jgi:hypothetical protein
LSPPACWPKPWLPPELVRSASVSVAKLSSLLALRSSSSFASSSVAILLPIASFFCGSMPYLSQRQHTTSTNTSLDGHTQPRRLHFHKLHN